MNLVLDRARSSWLLAFGDVITLLLTFFIVVVVMNKSEGSRIEQWVNQQLTESYQQLNETITANQIDFIDVQRESRGILLTIRGESAFQSGSYEPSEQLAQELSRIGKLLPSVKVLQLGLNTNPNSVIEQAQEDGYDWHAEVSVLGHTDTDWVNPESSLRNNFFLSTLRAEKVATELKMVSGLGAEQFSISGYGQWQPLFKNNNEQNKAQNRRVEILITAGFKEIN